MASVPPCGLKCLGGKMVNFATEQRKNFLRLGIFYVLLVEIASIFIRDLPNYACFWYPLLTQTVLLIMVFSVFLWRERLRFCFRKKFASVFLCLYYAFGVVALLANFSNQLYVDVVSFTLLGAATVLFLLSFLQTDEY